MGGKVDFGLIKEASRNELIKLLESIPESKAIVWDRQLAGAFELIGDFAFLRSHGVVKMYFISSDKLPTNNIKHIIFVTRPQTHHMDLINLQLRMEGVQTNTKKEFHLWCVPRVTLLCEARLQHHGIYGAFTTVTELPIHMFRLESDLATLELPMCYKDLQMNQDPSGLFHIARALMSIQGIFGLIPSIYGKGAAAKKVFDLMVGMRTELAGNEPQVPPQIDQLILIDRSIDLITPLATQLTYEGLIDEFFGINNCTVKLPAEKFLSNRLDSSSDSPPNDSSYEISEIKSLHLSSSDELFADIRDYNFSAVGPRLSSEAKEVSSQFEKRHHANTVSEIKLFVQKLPKMQVAKQSLATHTAIAELVQGQTVDSFFRPALQAEQELLKGSETDRVNPFIEESIMQKEPLIKVLRLICLQSVVNCGLKSRVLEFYKREILQTYGFEHFLTLENLEKAGLLTIQQTKGTYSTVRKTLRLTVDDVSESKPTDISYVHSGYAPLSVRLVEFLQCPGWRAITEVLNVLPGSTLTETQQLPSALRQRRNSGNSIQSIQGEPSIVIVCFIGGCTYSEVAALRFLSSRIDQGGPEYVILTTKMINGNTFIESLTEALHPKS